MVEVRVHLGHSEKRRNPRITPYIFTAKGKHKRKGIKITHLARSLSEACDLLFHAASQGKNILMIPSRKEQPVLPPPRSDSRARLIIGLVLLAWRGSLTSAAGSIKGGSCWAIYYSDWWKSDSCPEEDALSALEAVVSLKSGLKSLGWP